MSSISVSSDTKSEFNELQPEDTTHDEFVQELLAAYRRDDGEIINPDALADEIVAKVHKQIAASVELSAYKGVQDALDSQ